MPYLGELLALASPLAWAFAVILFRRTGERVGPVALNLFKNALVAPLFFLCYFLLDGSPPDGVVLADYGLLLASGAIGIALADTLFFMCLNRVGASRQAIINTTYSPPIIFLSVVFLGESLNLWQLVGVVLILGAVLSVGSRDPAAKRVRPPHLVTGILIGVGASISQAISIVMIKPSMADWPLLWMTSWRMLGGLLLSILVLPLIPSRARALGALRDRKVWGHMLPGVLLGSFVSLLLWMGGFKFADASVAASLNQTSTLFTFVLAVVLLKEPVTRRGLLGLALGVVGALFVTLMQSS